MRWLRCALPVLAGLAGAGLAAGASRIETGSAADEESCRITRKASRFGARDPQVFARIAIGRAGASGRLTVEWSHPGGEVVERAEYSDLPRGRPLCVLNAMPLAGFQAAERPGVWRIEARLDGRVAAEAKFEIEGAGARVRISGAVAEGSGPRRRIELTGAGFTADSTVHIARYTAAGGWQYLAAETPAGVAPDRLSILAPALAPGEYFVVVRSAEGAVSAPARLLIFGGESYRFPAAVRERWVITQRPYGAFSHWNRSRHAWDIAPAGDRRVAAMRSGIVRAHDLGMKQTAWKRSFGNYITIDHGDGEYSHYAHLQTGTFLVRTGQRVEQGQPLAMAGNSGYALGPGGGVHLHVHVTREASIASQSIPFEFGQPRAAGGAASPAEPAFSGTVEVGRWWSEVLPVARRPAGLRVRLEWESESADLDLHLVSPSGKHYGWYGETEGYSGARSRPEEFYIAQPEPGPWRVSVQGISAGGGSGLVETFKVRVKAE